ncbi:MAG: SurA N-terminal domain-containing protein [Desulfuromonadales bacterium]
MGKLITAVAGCMLLMLGVAWAEKTAVEVVAVVKNEAITSYQLEQKIQAMQQDPSQEGETDALRQKALDSLIEESLIRQRAEELGVEVTEGEVESAIRDIRQQNDLTEKQLEFALQGQGLSMQEYREGLREQILRYKVVGREMRDRTEVTSEDIREYFREHIDDYRQDPTLRLSRITIAVPEGATPEEAEKARTKAEEAVQRIRNGEDFSSVFLDLSTDPAVSGGDMGTFAEGELAPAFDRAVRNLEEGEVSSVLEFEGSYYIFHVDEKNFGNIRKFDQVKEEIRETLLGQKTGSQREDWIKELREKAFIEIR